MSEQDIFKSGLNFDKVFQNLGKKKADEDPKKQELDQKTLES